MLHGGVLPDTSDRHGLGLRASMLIPAGTVIWFPCPNCPRWSPQQRKLLPEDVDAKLDTWGHLLADGTLLVPCGGAFLMNHSCTANVLDFGLDFGVAVTDIQPGTEITCDYGTFCADAGWSMRCHCGETCCRGEVSTADYGRCDVRRTWSDRLAAALPRVTAVPQPLGDLLATFSPAYRRAHAGVTALAGGETEASITRPAFQRGAS